MREMDEQVRRFLEEEADFMNEEEIECNSYEPWVHSEHVESELTPKLRLDNQGHLRVHVKSGCFWFDAAQLMRELLARGVKP